MWWHVIIVVTVFHNIFAPFARVAEQALRQSPDTQPLGRAAKNTEQKVAS